MMDVIKILTILIKAHHNDIVYLVPSLNKYMYRFVALSCPCIACRSPWSNKYDPPINDGAVPSDKLRSLEVKTNQAFDTYREM